MNFNPYLFKEIGTTDVRTTNKPRIVTATTTTLVAAPAGSAAPAVPGTIAIAVYQIDYEVAGATNTLIIGDNAGVDGTDNIFLNTVLTGRGTIVFPQGITCRPGKALVAVTTGGSVNTWVRVTYQQM